MRCRYWICDVFTDRRFGGNPLAVLPDARGLSDGLMQQVAREFNFSETTFVLPAEAGHTRRVRIFTPRSEIPFAGHPNIGTAFVLAHCGELGALAGPTRIVFEEPAGPVPITIETREGRPMRCELCAPEPLRLGPTVAVERSAAALGLAAAEVATTSHAPQVASVGLPFLLVELRSLDALARARPVQAVLEGLDADGLPHQLHAYTRGDGDADFRARMFAPLAGVPEDPATGSANCALAGLRGHLDPRREGTLRWRIEQGHEMGRPSALYACAVKRDGEVVEVRIAGDSVLVAEGEIEVG